MYYIRVKYFFNQGTHNAPKSGALRIGLNGTEDLTTRKEIGGRPRPIYMMESRQEALRQIERITGGSLHQYSKSTYTADSVCEFRYGEYAAPEYTIIKKRTQNKGA